MVSGLVVVSCKVLIEVKVVIGVKVLRSVEFGVALSLHLGFCVGLWSGVRL